MKTFSATVVLRQRARSTAARLPQALLLIATLTVFGAGAEQPEIRTVTVSPVPFKQLVVLCATEPGSARFEAAWLGWLQANPDAETDQVVREVISKAGTLRSMGLAGVEPGPVRRKLSDPQIAARMRELAEQSSTGPQTRVLSTN